MTIKCKLVGGFTDEYCAYNSGGNSRLLLANWQPPTDIQGDETEIKEGFIGYKTEGKYITSIIPGTIQEGATNFVEMPAFPETILGEDKLTEGGNGGKFRTQTVTAIFPANDPEIIEQLDALSLGRYVAITVDKNGKARIFGRINGLKANVADYSSGTTMEDSSGITITLESKEPETAFGIKDIATIPIEPKVDITP